MIYQPDSTIRARRCYIEPNSHSKFPYLTVKEMRALFPDSNFIIVGEIGGLSRPPNYTDVLFADGVKRLSVLPRGSLKQPFEWIAGYIPVQGNTYLSLVKSMLPAFLR